MRAGWVRMGHGRVPGWAFEFVFKNIPERIGNTDKSKIAAHILAGKHAPFRAKGRNERK